MSEKVRELPFYKLRKGADQREKEQRLSLVDLGTGSHGLLDGENCHQDVWFTLDVCHQNVGYAKKLSTFLNHMVLNWTMNEGD